MASPGVTIRTKILGILTLLLLAMALVAGFSVYRVSGVARELHTVANHYLPILRSIESIEDHALEQELHYTRLIRLHEMRGAPTVLREREERQFLERGQAVDRELESTIALLETARQITAVPIDQAEMERLLQMVQEIDREHTQFESHARETLAAIEQDPGTGRLMESALEQEEDDFTESLDVLREQVETFISRSTGITSDHEEQVIYFNVAATVLAVLVGLALSVLFANGLVAPIRKLVSGTKAVTEGNLDVILDRSSGDEIGELTGSFNSMVHGLRDRERIKETFGQYVDPRIVDKLLNDATAAGEGSRETMAIFFSDVAGFTSISEKLTPASLVRLMNRYLSAMSAKVQERDGVIDKFVGDAIMAFWGPPFVEANRRSQLACESALDQLKALDQFNATVGEAIGVVGVLDAIDIRIGIHTGEVVAGNMGSETARNFTIMGDSVNLASRLEGANKQYGSRVLLSEATVAEISGFVLRELDLIQVKGRDQPVRVFELVGRESEVERYRLDAIALFQEALPLYRAGDWDRAEQAFRDLLASHGADRATRLFLARIEHLRKHAPTEDWTGVWHMKSK
ncbi:MAG: HAMP domain-containing protein [Spirochaetales bacterium]|nr:HAMP domain-containing protein [Spirochaetales bacterium]